LGEEEITIGREAGNTIQLTEQNVSRQHARLTQGPDGWVLEDLDSYNGIKVNGVPVEAQIPLNEGDLVQIGDYHLSLAENAEKTALNVDKPGVAANSNEVGEVLPPSGAAGAATGTPAATAAAVGLEAAEAPSYDSYDEPEKKSSKGGLLFIILLLGLSVGAYFMFLRGDPKESPGDQRQGPAMAASAGTPGDNSNSAKPTTPTSEDSPEGSSGKPEGVPEDSAGPPVDSAGPVAGSDGTVDDSAGPVAEPDPAIKPTKKKKRPGTKKKKKKKPEPEPVPAGDPVELLGDARKASLAGNASQAYKLAKQSYSIDKNRKALKLMGVSACKMGDAAKAQKVYNKVDDNTKKALVSLCSTKGVTLQ
ncbi:MAG TPA: FHA domain-containing protein, partial [Nannocystis exedens]|nr:FHA domain-containing protein [Nannocystis exedens]